MTYKKVSRIAVPLSILIIHISLAAFASAQESVGTPELSVVGIELGNRESAKKYLVPGFSPRIGEDGKASYYFYNEWGTQVMRLTATSADDRFLITEIEVFSVSKKYRSRHYQDTENGLMLTENGIFIGFRQSAMHLFVGIKNAGKKNTITPDGLIDIKGNPVRRETDENGLDVLTYELTAVQVKDFETELNYTGSFQFKKKKLVRFTLKISPDEEDIAKQ